MSVRLKDLIYAHCAVCGRPAQIDGDRTRCSEGHEVRVAEITGPMNIHAPHLAAQPQQTKFREFL